MDDSAEVSTLSYIVLLKSLDKSLDKSLETVGRGQVAGCDDDGGNAVPDSTTSLPEKTLPPHSFHCGDDVLVPKQDGKYYLGSIIELSDGSVPETEAQCLIKFGDGTRSWAPTCAVKLLSAPPPDDGCIMCVVCKRREGAARSEGAGGAGEAVIACDMCGRGYHAKCHTPPVDTWINGAAWNCRRCVDQRYRVAAAENRAQKRAVVRLKGDVLRRVHHHTFMQQACDTASTTSSTASEHGKDDSHCYCGEKTDDLAQMLMCCRCSRWFHQRCVASLQYPLYAGDKLYIFGCAVCNGGAEYLRRLELRWLDLAHLALYNLTAFNSRNYFDLDAVIMPYIMDNWHALQLPQKMWSTSVGERRERILTALTASRARFKCGREMKKRATIWGLRVRRPPPFPLHLSSLAQAKDNEPLTDQVVSRLAPRLRFLPRTRSVSPPPNNKDSTQPTSSNNGNSSYTTHNQNMIVPVDGHWLNLMMGKRFRQNLNCNDTENDSPCSSPSPTEFMNNTLSSHSASFSLRYDMLKMNDLKADSAYAFDDETDSAHRSNKYKKPLKLYKLDYHNGGFVKKSVPFSKQPTGSKRKFTNSDEKKRKINKHMPKNNIEQKCLRNSSAKEQKSNEDATPLRSSTAFSRNSQQDKDRSPSADPEIILKGDCSTSSFDSVKPLECDVPPPAVALSSPPSPAGIHTSDDSASRLHPPQRKLSTLSDSLLPCSVHIDKLTEKDVADENMVSGVFAGAHTSKIAVMNLELSKLSTKNIIEHSKIISLQQWGPERGVSYERESSGDETSSRGTLDAIIPPLKNFQGINNPFLMLYSERSDKKTPFSMTSKLFSKQNGNRNGVQHVKSRLSLPMQLTPAVRPLKRQLSEKDLVIGPNGEVKRRKHRRPRKNGQLNQSCPLPDRGKSSQMYSRQSDEMQKKDFNGRRLRKRQERNYYENGRRTTAGGAAAMIAPPMPLAPVDSLHLSPQKMEPPEPQQLLELKTSVRSYFGALTRMRAGEGFTVAARRTTQAGQSQYLIEWASPHAS